MSHYVGLITLLHYMRRIAAVLTSQLKSAEQCGQLSWLGLAEQDEGIVYRNDIVKTARKIDK